MTDLLTCLPLPQVIVKRTETCVILATAANFHARVELVVRVMRQDAPQLRPQPLLDLPLVTLVLIVLLIGNTRAENQPGP